MDADLIRDATKLVSVVDQLLAWMIESRPELEDGPQVAHVRKYTDRLRKSLEFDLNAAMADSATRGRIKDPGTSTAAIEVAKLRSGTQKKRLAEVFFQYDRGLTADEAVRLAGLAGQGSPWHRVSDLKEAGVLRSTGRTRPTETGAEAEILMMTIMARTAWIAKHGDLAPAEVVAIFGDDVETV